MVSLGLSMGLSPREPADRFVSLAQEAEESGVDTLWVVDSQLAMKDAYVTLAILARETDRLRIGPGVTNTITRDESVVANAMATLASIAPGRVQVGFGSGDSAVYPLGRKPMAVASCRESLVRLRSLLKGGPGAGLNGDLGLSFSADPPPTLHLAASQPRMLHLAGEIADGVIIMGPADPESVRSQLAEVDAGARSAGRRPSDIHRDLWVTISADGDGSLADVRSWASAQARWMSKWKHLPSSLEPFRDEMQAAADGYDFSTHLSMRAAHADTVGDDFAQILAVAGTPEQCALRLEALIATGVDRLTLTLLPGGRERRLRTIVEIWKSLSHSPSTL